MNRTTIILIAALVAIVTVGTASTAAGTDPQVAKLKQQLRSARLDLADANNQIDAQNATIEDLQAANTRLRTRIANWPDPIDVITSRDPDGLWQAMRAIWLAFPNLPEGALCGYDKTYTPGDGNVLALTTYQFARWTGC